VTATIHEIHPETWSARVHRLAVQCKQLRRVASEDRDDEWVEAWRLANHQLAVALDGVE
jgi:hypothetical protein